MPPFIRDLVEKQTIKLKSVLDRLFFLNECEVFGVVPKCVRLKRTFSITFLVSTEDFAKKAITENIINAKRQLKEFELLIDEDKKRLYPTVSNELKVEIDDYLSSILTKVNTGLLSKLSRLKLIVVEISPTLQATISPKLKLVFSPWVLNMYSEKIFKSLI